MKKTTDTNPTIRKRQPMSVSIAKKGINTAADFANVMSALMTDLAEGRVSPAIGNSMCNAGGKLLKVVELQQRYGVQLPGQTKRMLRLTDVKLDAKSA